MPQKKQQQRKVVHVHFTQMNEHYYFGSLPAIFLMFDHERVGVSKSTLDRHDFDTEPYQNEDVVIRIGTLRTPGALRKLVH